MTGCAKLIEAMLRRPVITRIGRITNSAADQRAQILASVHYRDPTSCRPLAVFAEFERDILRDRVKAGIAQARKEGRPHGRPAKIVGKNAGNPRPRSQRAEQVKQLNIGRTSVRRLLDTA
jgi:DNA invertase Pin-like site-specific DNA recombinase